MRVCTLLYLDQRPAGPHSCSASPGFLTAVLGDHRWPHIIVVVTLMCLGGVQELVDFINVSWTQFHAVGGRRLPLEEGISVAIAVINPSRIISREFL